MLVSEATERKPFGLRVVGHVAAATGEDQIPAIGSDLCTAPVEAGVTAIALRTIGVSQVPCGM